MHRDGIGIYRREPFLLDVTPMFSAFVCTFGFTRAGRASTSRAC